MLLLSHASTCILGSKPNKIFVSINRKNFLSIEFRNQGLLPLALAWLMRVLGAGALEYGIEFVCLNPFMRADTSIRKGLNCPLPL